MNVGARWFMLNKTRVDNGDQTGQNRHRHLKDVTNTFRLHHPLPTLMLHIKHNQQKSETDYQLLIMVSAFIDGL